MKSKRKNKTVAPVPAWKQGLVRPAAHFRTVAFVYALLLILTAVQPRFAQMLRAGSLHLLFAALAVAYLLAGRPRQSPLPLRHVLGLGCMAVLEWLALANGATVVDVLLIAYAGTALLLRIIPEKAVFAAAAVPLLLVPLFSAMQRLDTVSLLAVLAFQLMCVAALFAATAGTAPDSGGLSTEKAAGL